MPNIEDDPSIPSDWRLLRRIPPWHVHDHELDFAGKRRLTRQAFDDDELSVGVRELIEQKGLDPAAVVLEGHDGFGLVELSVEYVRQELGLLVRRDTEGEPWWHALVLGNKTKGIRGKLVRHAETRWILRPGEKLSETWTVGD